MGPLDHTLKILTVISLLVGIVVGILVIRKEWPQDALPVATIVPAPLPPPKETGSIPIKKKTAPKLPPAPNFFSDPLGWLRWNDARNEALCAMEEPPYWCSRP